MRVESGSYSRDTIAVQAKHRQSTGKAQAKHTGGTITKCSRLVSSLSSLSSLCSLLSVLLSLLASLFPLLSLARRCVPVPEHGRRAPACSRGSDRRRPSRHTWTRSCLTTVLPFAVPGKFRSTDVQATRTGVEEKAHIRRHRACKWVIANSKPRTCPRSQFAVHS